MMEEMTVRIDRPEPEIMPRFRGPRTTPMDTVLANGLRDAKAILAEGTASRQVRRRAEIFVCRGWAASRREWRAVRLGRFGA